MPTHPSECWIIEITVISGKSQNFFTIFLDQILRKSNKFHLIIVKPVLSIAKMFSIDILVIFNKFNNEIPHIL